MPSVSITRLRVRGLHRMPRFMWHAMRSIGQVRGSPGYLAGGTATEPGLVFWTVTVWDHLDAMRAFRNSGRHMTAMKHLIDMCSEASYAHWEQAGRDLPSSDEMHRRMSAEGKLSKVRVPSPRHEAGNKVSDTVPGKVREQPPR